jgi:hypothetical protein
MDMRNAWIVVLMAAVLTTAGLLAPASRLASAQETTDRSHMALVLDRALDRGLPANPAPQYVSHELCGIGLGGYCPGRYRSCIRSGRPRAECQARLERCEACNQAMVACRQKVGHAPGYTCVRCRAALDKCRAGLAVPEK